eukprot:1138465-Pelagomonas_calceolata.AAC.3
MVEASNSAHPEDLQALPAPKRTPLLRFLCLTEATNKLPRPHPQCCSLPVAEVTKVTKAKGLQSKRLTASLLASDSHCAEQYRRQMSSTFCCDPYIASHMQMSTFHFITIYSAAFMGSVACFHFHAHTGMPP